MSNNSQIHRYIFFPFKGQIRIKPCPAEPRELTLVLLNHFFKTLVLTIQVSAEQDKKFEKCIA